MYNENAETLLERITEDKFLLAEILGLNDPRVQLARLVEMGKEQNLPVVSEDVAIYLAASSGESYY